MKLGLLLVAYWLRMCIGGRLTPLENNDKLQDINNQYVAEWQWESWPMKQETSGQDVRSPGARMNVALWKDSSGPSWYIFGGQPADSGSRKIYSDLWKYSVGTRMWERFFPSQSDMTGTSPDKIDGMTTLRASLFDEDLTQNSKPKNYNVVLCGRIIKTNSTKPKKVSIWTNSSRRRKFEEEEKTAELKSLAVYAPRTMKSNTVWQIDLKDKLWTAYVCCCDSSTSPEENSTTKPTPQTSESADETTTKESFKAEGSKDPEKNESSIIEFKIDKTEDEMDAEQQHLSINNLKNKKKKINKSKKGNEDANKKGKDIEKRSSGVKEEKESETKATTPDEGSPTTAEPSLGTKPAKNETKISKKEKYNLKLKANSNKTEAPVQNVTAKPKMASKYCPEFSDDGEPVTWCDGNNEVLITTDISSPRIILWIFNLRTSHWSQEEVNLLDEWSGCSNTASVRYAGTEEEVYIICSFPDVPKRPPKESTKPSKNPSRLRCPVKIVYRINYKRRVLENLGELQLPSYLGTPEGIETWENDTKSILQVIVTPDGETILMLVYQDSVDLWLLTKDHRGKSYFDYIEKIWRGSALKWFSKYNSALYNLQFTSESGKSETILIPNPRCVPINEYWPRERGRFIIRIFKNDNLNNETFENRTREQNLTYEPFQNNVNVPPEDRFRNRQSINGFTLFLVLALLSALVMLLFISIRRILCYKKPPVRVEYNKSPLIIRYSVIPEDLLFPVA